MNDEAWIDRLKLLKVDQIADLYEALGEYWRVMPDGLTPDEIETQNLIDAMLVILAGGRV